MWIPTSRWRLLRLFRSIPAPADKNVCFSLPDKMSFLLILHHHHPSINQSLIIVVVVVYSWGLGLGEVLVARSLTYTVNEATILRVFQLIASRSPASQATSFPPPHPSHVHLATGHQWLPLLKQRNTHRWTVACCRGWRTFRSALRRCWWCWTCSGTGRGFLPMSIPASSATPPPSLCRHLSIAWSTCWNVTQWVTSELFTLLPKTTFPLVSLAFPSVYKTRFRPTTKPSIKGISDWRRKSSHSPLVDLVSQFVSVYYIRLFHYIDTHRLYRSSAIVHCWRHWRWRHRWRPCRWRQH